MCMIFTVEKRIESLAQPISMRKLTGMPQVLVHGPVLDTLGYVQSHELLSVESEEHTAPCKKYSIIVEN